MASPFHRLNFYALRSSHRTFFRRRHLLQPSLDRAFHSSPNPLVDEPPKTPTPKTFDPATLDPTSRSEYNLLTPSERTAWLEEQSRLDAAYPSQTSHLLSLASQAANESEISFPEEFVPPAKKSEIGLMAMGEEDENECGPDETYEGDDIPSIAHADLEAHREVREMMRIAAWEMPMLSKLVVPFKPPALREVCRYRYTTYCGETHPAEKKVVVEFATRDLMIQEAAGLTDAQRIKLIKLAGTRYDPRTDVVKISCEIHETQVANKKHLSDTVDALIAEAKDSKDMFEDVPVDFRHVKLKPKYEFPEAWKLRGQEGERRLEAERERMMIERGQGDVVDGSQIVKEILKRRPTQRARQPLTMPTSRARAPQTRARARR